MRTPTGAWSAGGDPGTGKAGRALLSGVLGLSLAAMTALLATPAQADPEPPVIPSRSAVEAAKKAAADQTGEVAAIERRLAAASGRLETLGRAAGRAAEAYNGAVYRWQLATKEATLARARAGKAQRTLESQQVQIGRFAAANYQGAGDLTQLGAVFTGGGPQEVLDSAAAAHSVSSAMQGAYLRFTATRLITNAFHRQAEQALAGVEVAKAAAAAARTRAEAAEAAQVAAVASLGAERRQQIARLAVLRKTSYRVAEQRQHGLEELARQRAAAVAAQKAEELRKRTAARQAAEAAERAQEAARAADRAHRASAGRAAQRAAQAAREARSKATRPEREAAARRAENAAAEAQRASAGRSGTRGGRSGNSSGNAGRGNGKAPAGGKGTGRTSPGPGGAKSAIAFAKQQLGEPYVWGAAGPSSWDCSGLTMAAWRQAGVALPHYSVAQYEQVKKVGPDDLRPGDLIFWADSPGDPGTIFHVALYLGDGKMIHAPRTGRPVQIESVYYWESPDFYGRP